MVRKELEVKALWYRPVEQNDGWDSLVRGEVKVGQPPEKMSFTVS
jgi:hypothetical protein